MVRVVAVEAMSAVRALGFLTGRGVIKADVKEAFADEIEAMFGGAR